MLLAAILIITLFVAAMCGLEVSALVVTLFLDGPRYNRTPRPLLTLRSTRRQPPWWGFLPCGCAIFPMRIAHRKTLTVNARRALRIREHPEADRWYTSCSAPGSLTSRLTFPNLSPEGTMTDWIQLIRAEYHEMPGLHLTRRQIQRLWNLEAAMCDAVLEALEGARFLRRTHTGGYVKA